MNHTKRFLLRKSLPHDPIEDEIDGNIMISAKDSLLHDPIGNDVSHDPIGNDVSYDPIGVDVLHNPTGDDLEEDGPKCSLGLTIKALDQNGDVTGHVVQGVKQGEFGHRLGLRKGDKIMYIDGIPATSLDSDYITDYIDGVRARVENFDMVIWRTNKLEDGRIEIDEFLIEFRIEHLSRGDRLISCVVRLIRTKIKPPDFLTDVNFMEETLSIVRVKGDAPLYLGVNGKGNLVVKPLGPSGKHDRTCQFLRFIFNGLVGESKKRCRRFLSVFQSMQTKEFVCLKGSSTVGTVGKVSRIDGVEKIRTADPSFFFVNRFSDGVECSLESAVKPRNYLSWSQGKLQMKKYDKDVILDVQQDVCFEIVAVNDLVPPVDTSELTSYVSTV